MSDETAFEFRAALHNAWRPILFKFYVGLVINTVVAVSAAYLMATRLG